LLDGGKRRCGKQFAGARYIGLACGIGEQAVMMAPFVFLFPPPALLGGDTALSPIQQDAKADTRLMSPASVALFLV
jgi:hypothetical protein